MVFQGSGGKGEQPHGSLLHLLFRILWHARQTFVLGPSCTVGIIRDTGECELRDSSNRCTTPDDCFHDALLAIWGVQLVACYES